MNTSKLFFGLLFLIIFFTESFGQSPLKKNVYTFGGSVSLSYQNNKFEVSTDKTFSILVSPSFGYFITDNIMVLGKLGFTYYESKYEDNEHINKYYWRDYSLGSSFRYYFNAEKFIPFLGAGVGYTKYTYGYSTEIFFTGGMNHFLSKQIALEPFVSYSILLTDNVKRSTYYLRFGAGIVYYFTD